MLRAGPSTLRRSASLSPTMFALRNSGIPSRIPLVSRIPPIVTQQPPHSRYLSSTGFRSVQNPQVTNPTFIPDQSHPSTSQSQSNANSGNTKTDRDGDGEQPTGAYARFKLLAKKYGWYAFGMYWILSTIDFSLTFMVVHGLGAERIEPVIESSLRSYRLWRHGEEETRRLEQGDKERREEVKKEQEENKKGKGGYWGSRMFWAEAILAYTIHKTALLPFRAGLTVAWTPKVVKWLRARGWAGKEGTTRAIAHAQSKLKRNKAD